MAKKVVPFPSPANDVVAARGVGGNGTIFSHSPRLLLTRLLMPSPTRYIEVGIADLQPLLIIIL